MVVDVIFMGGLISLLLCIFVILVWLHCYHYAEVDSEDEERKLRSVIFRISTLFLSKSSLVPHFILRPINP